MSQRGKRLDIGQHPGRYTHSRAGGNPERYSTANPDSSKQRIPI